MTLASANSEISLGLQNFNVLRDPDHATFKGDLSSMCWDFI